MSESSGATQGAVPQGPPLETAGASNGSPARGPYTPSGDRRASTAVAGRKEIGDFFIGRVLGEGSYARVFLVRAKDTGRDYAMKVMEKKFIIKEGKSKEVQMERRVLSEVSHPNIVRLFFSFHDKDRLYMVLDLCPGGELAKLVRYSRDNRLRGVNRALDEDQTRFYLAETIAAVQHLHSVGILHRDIKPENVLLSATGHVKLTDFGTAKDLKAAEALSKSLPPDAPPRKDTFCGTAEYVSPEVLQDAEAGIGADLWALGIMTHTMLVGKTPFLSESEFLTFQSILLYAGVQDKEDEELTVDADFVKKTPETFAFPESSDGTALSQEALDLVKQLLHPEPSKRLGYSSPSALQEHPFFKGLNFGALDKLDAPPLPYKIEIEAPIKDGAKQDWLMTDEDGIDMEELEIDDRKSTRSNRESMKRRSTAPSGLERFMLQDEEIKMDGSVTIASYAGFVNNRRHMVLTEKGRLLLIDPLTLTVKEEVNVLKAAVTVRSNGKDFDVQTPKRTLRLRDNLGNADKWKEAIEQV